MLQDPFLKFYLTKRLKVILFFSDTETIYHRSACVWWQSGNLWRSEEYIAGPGAGVTSVYELPNVGTGDWTWGIWKQP